MEIILGDSNINLKMSDMILSSENEHFKEGLLSIKEYFRQREERQKILEQNLHNNQEKEEDKIEKVFEGLITNEHPHLQVR